MAKLSRASANALLLACAMSLGISYIFIKLCAARLPAFEVMALRFSIAAVIVAFLFRRRLKTINCRSLGCGIILGTVAFLSSTAIFYGTANTDASIASFLTNTSTVFVPLVAAFCKRRLPNRTTMLCTCAAMLGIFLLSFESGFSFSGGALLCLLGGVFYTAFILLTDAFARKADALLLGVLQLVVMALLSMLCMLLFTAPVMPQTESEWGALLGLALLCSAFCFVAQPYAQSFTTPENTALILATIPVWGAVFGLVVLSESFTLQKSIGALLVLLSVFMLAFKKQSHS